MSAMSERAAVIDQLITDLPAEDLKALAERLASQVGYVLEPEPEHPDGPAQGPGPGEAVAYQTRVARWMLACFTPEIAEDVVERNDRFIEEALELVQANGYSAERAHALVDYVFGRPVGEPDQEVGGVMVTLAALCNAARLDMFGAAQREIVRIEDPGIMAKIKAKQAAKPTGSALPVAATPTREADHGRP